MLDIERAIYEEWKPMMSAGAAARELVISLRCSDKRSKLAELLEAMLADSNRGGHKFAKARDALRLMVSAVKGEPLADGRAPTVEQALAEAEKVLKVEYDTRTIQ